MTSNTTTTETQQTSTDPTFAFRRGLSWLIAFIVVSLAAARFIFWQNSWNFAWIPKGLPSVLAFFFLFFHLVLGPLFVIFFETLCEMKKILKNDNSWRRPRFMLKDIARKYYTVRYVLNGALAYGLVGAALVTYTNLKPTIPLLNGTIYDHLLFQWDGYLLQILSLGGIVTIPRHFAVATFFDKIYFHLWTLACITLAMSFRDETKFWRFTAAWCLAFGLSMPISILFPALGPAFYRPELFAYMKDTGSAEVMERLWKYYVTFKGDPVHTPITIANGIVAMPSLHAALVYLSAIKLGKSLPGLRHVLSGIFVLFIIATVYLGWHYLSDGIVGIVLGWFAHKISTVWFYKEARQGDV